MSVIVSFLLIGAILLLEVGSSAQSLTGDNPAICGFELHISQSAINDLRQRIRATRWPEQETVKDRSQGL